MITCQINLRISLRKAHPIACVSAPSHIPHPCPIPVIPVYTTVKMPKSGTSSKGTRQTYGRKADSDRQGMGYGFDWGDTGGCERSASELGLDSVLPRFALDRLRPNQGVSKSRLRSNQGMTELRSHPQEYPVRGRNAACPSTAWDCSIELPDDHLPIFPSDLHGDISVTHLRARALSVTGDPKTKPSPQAGCCNGGDKTNFNFYSTISIYFTYICPMMQTNDWKMCCCMPLE